MGFSCAYYRRLQSLLRPLVRSYHTWPRAQKRKEKHLKKKKKCKIKTTISEMWKQVWNEDEIWTSKIIIIIFLFVYVAMGNERLLFENVFSALFECLLSNVARTDKFWLLCLLYCTQCSSCYVLCSPCPLWKTQKRRWKIDLLPTLWVSTRRLKLTENFQLILRPKWSWKQMKIITYFTVQ